MTAEERAAIRRIVAETRKAQGLPRHVEDPAVLLAIAEFIDQEAEAEGGDRRGRKAS